ncbi:beta-1,4-N-acetylgalactosaminyltransferase bre-4 [Toxorhynchites rutilus septentrionalis]|uniref:beta-1,4-N-acetylgalactosaminyltransferase bre-4 n=1 Tax=Toxorhynchites rutilus septentrionalis TaxID=329112 RepID=UPI0024790E02|nr:beta-1,4-N-acetylgalactosaminyltransferase bre-4 [Toxorhynchites rutilus septentrionalis]
MASWNRVHALKGALVAGFLLILLNLLGSRWDSMSTGLPRVGIAQWPKRTRTSLERLLQPHAPNKNQNNDSSHHHQQATVPNDEVSGNNNRTLAGTSGLSPRAETINSQQESNSLGKTKLLNGNLTNSPKPQNPSQPNDVVSSAVPVLIVASNNVNSSLTASISGSVTINPSSTSKNSTSLSDNNKILIDDISSNRSEAASDNSRKIVPEALQRQRFNESLNYVQTEDNTGIIGKLMRKLGQESCPPIPPNLDGPIEVSVAFESLAAVEQQLASKLQPGGQYTPRECIARDRVAIIVPYRDREQHLPVFLKNIHPFLMKQQVEYGVYIVEQAAGSQFNRAALMNVGFVEAMKQKNWDCLVFHDVDLLPMDDRNLYTCPDQPRHMSVAVDTFGFKLPYSTIFGGVSAMTVKQFRTVNGFSNSFWGWGGEDDDMSNRLKHVGFHIARYPINIARYTMLSHKKEKANPKRYEKLVTGSKRFDSDGLNSLHYNLVNLIPKSLFTWVHVEISPDSS